MEDKVRFIKNAILGEKVGAISPSSKYVIRNVIKNIGNKPLKIVVEYGPGDGVLTTELLKILDKNGKILLVELDSNFIDLLKKINDPRVIIVNGKIEDVSSNLSKYGFNDADLIVSSIPFSLINKSDREKIVENTFNSLKIFGKFIVFHQYSIIMSEYIEKYFKRSEVWFEIRNIFPCFILSAEKNKIF